MSDFFDTLGPSISDIEVSLYALTFALSKAKKRISTISAKILNYKLEEEGSEGIGSFEAEFDSLDKSLNLFLSKLVELESPF